MINEFQEREIKDYYIVGHGMGAMVAVELALMDQNRAKGLVFINPIRPDGY